MEIHCERSGNDTADYLFAVILGIALGFLIAVIRSTYDKTGKGKILNFLAKVYLTVIRGTPVLVQLLIITCRICKRGYQ